MSLHTQKEGAATGARTSEGKRAEKGPTVGRRGFPPTVQPIAVLTDDSESMDKYRTETTNLAKNCIESVKTSGSDRALNIVYLLMVVIAADGIKTNGWQRLGEATDVPHEPDGNTPIGDACGLPSDMIEGFVFDTLVKATSRARPIEVVIFSDLKATGETLDETKAGVEKLVATVKKARGRITVVGPSADVTDQDLARALLGPERKPLYIGAEPQKILKVVLDTMS